MLSPHVAPDVAFVSTPESLEPSAVFIPARFTGLLPIFVLQSAPTVAPLEAPTKAVPVFVPLSSFILLTPENPSALLLKILTVICVVPAGATLLEVLAIRVQD